MSRFGYKEKMFGEFPVIELTDSTKGQSFEIALRGATPLKYNINYNNTDLDILDGFASSEEFVYSKGARCWIMAPFANRLPDGKYSFEGNDYKVNPIPPRNYVIHGFTAFETFSIEEVNEETDSISVELVNKKTRPGVFEGYPFALDVQVSFKLEENRLTVEVEGCNRGDVPLPFGSGWHPYFKTGDGGIDHLILTMNAGKIIRLDEKYFPLQGNLAYASVDDYPELNFSSKIDEGVRRINKRKLDTCYDGLVKDDDGFSRASILDPDNGLKLSMFQEGGVTLAFSGDSLSTRPRKSVALEPMQFITNAFNRSELADKIKVAPGESSRFKFGVEISN